MKNLINALRMSVVFAILMFFAACTQNNSHTPVPDPNPTPKPEMKINSFGSDPGSVSYNGVPNSGKVTISWSTSNAKSVYLNDIAVASSGNIVTDTLLLQSNIFILRIVDEVGKSISSPGLNVPVTVDPTFAKMCGTTGLSWKTTRNTSVRISDGNLLELLQPSELDDVFTFYPTGRSKVYYGTVNPLPLSYLEEEYKFFPATSELAIQHYDVQPIRKVEFGVNTMTWSHTKNGFIYTRYFERL